MDDHNNRIDPEFAGLPLKELADAALDQARALGAQHADFRVERIRGQRIALSDGRLQSLSDGDDSGLAVRVVVDGTWGFASAVDLTADAARTAARQAVEVARVAAAMNTERIELAPEAAHGDVTWVSAYEIDPFTVSPREKVDLLADWSTRLLAHEAVSQWMAGAAAPLWKPPVDRTRPKGWPSLAGRYTGFSVTDPRAVAAA